MPSALQVVDDAVAAYPPLNRVPVIGQDLYQGCCPAAIAHNPQSVGLPHAKCFKTRK
jgi:hypothetical protein